MPEQVGVMKVRQCRFHVASGLLAAALSWSARASASEVQVGPSRPVDPTVSPVPLTGSAAGVASDGIDWLVLSSDSMVISAARVTADGTVLDQPSFVVAEAPTVLGASLAFDGIEYVAAWAESQAADQAWSVRLRRIDANSSLSNEVTVGAINPPPPRLPTVALASGAWGELVVWCVEPSLGGKAWCSWAQVSGDTVVATDAITFEAGIDKVDVAASGSSFLIVASTWDNDVFMVRVGSDGKSVHTNPEPIAATDGIEVTPSVAPAESGWAVLWQSGDATLKSALVSPTGSIQPSATPVLDDGPLINRAFIEETPDGFVVVGERKGDSVFARFLDTTLAPLTDVITVTSAGEYTLGPGPSAWGDSSLLMSWSGPIHEAASAPLATRLSSTGEILDASALLVSTRANNQFSPAAARGGDAWLVAWEDQRSESSLDIYAQRIGDDALPLAKAPILVASDSVDDAAPAVAGSENGWFVAWQSETKDRPVRGARISTTGEVLDSPPITMGTSHSRPSVAFDGTNWVVGWVSGDSQVNGTARITRIDALGNVLDGGSIAVSQVDAARGPIQIEIDSQGCLVSWLPPDGGLVKRHVDATGSLVEAEPSYLLGAEVQLYGHELATSGDGSGWLFWSKITPHALIFQNIGQSASQTFGSGYFDLIEMGDQALAAWGGDTEALRLGLAALGGSLKTSAVLGKDSTQPALAVRDATSGLLSVAKATPGGLPGVRVHARLLEVVESGGDGEGGSDAGSSGGSAGENGNVAASGGDGSRPDAGSGGTEAASGGAPTGSGGAPDEAIAGSDSTGPAGSSSGGLGSIEPDDDNAEGCSCRNAGHTGGSGGTWLAALTGVLPLLRRRKHAQL